MSELEALQQWSDNFQRFTVKDPRFEPGNAAYRPSNGLSSYGKTLKGSSSVFSCPLFKGGGFYIFLKTWLDFGCFDLASQRVLEQSLPPEIWTTRLIKGQCHCVMINYKICIFWEFKILYSNLTYCLIRIRKRRKILYKICVNHIKNYAQLTFSATIVASVIK